LSIDMGIRNLAYCTVALPIRTADRGVGRLLGEDWKAGKLGAEEADRRRPWSTPRVLEWRRTAVSRAAFQPPSMLAHDAALTSSLDASTPAGVKAVKEIFDPPTLAKHAQSILASLVSSPAHGSGPPHTILIERQRWRSGGGAAVQEWTLRVNSLEAMLWSGLEMLRSHGLWAGSVSAVNPAAVGRFWVGAEGAGTGRDLKVAKVGIAEGWAALEEVRGLRECGWDEGTRATREGFLGAGTGKKRKGKKAGRGEGDEVEQVEDFRKRDDLADCLLQGMAWIRWEENRRAIIEGRWEECKLPSEI